MTAAWKTQILILHYLDIVTVVFSYFGLLVLPPAARRRLVCSTPYFSRAKCLRTADTPSAATSVVTVWKYIFLSSSLLSMAAISPVFRMIR